MVGWVVGAILRSADWVGGRERGFGVGGRCK